MSEATDLVVIDKSNAMAVFTTKEQLDPLLEKIEAEARSLVPDLTTKKGRDAIASMAHKFPAQKRISTTPAKTSLPNSRRCRSRSTRAAALFVSDSMH